jgi:NLI interacting factor-like phosphatase
MAVKAFIIDMAMYKVPIKQRGLESVLFDRSLCLVGQDRPTALFRCNFTPSSRYLIASNTRAVCICNPHNTTTHHITSHHVGSPEMFAIHPTFPYCFHSQRPTIARKMLNSTNGTQQKCSDCVGDAILRLLGISSKSSASTSSETPDFSNKSEVDDDTKSTASSGSSLFCSTEAISSAFSGSSSSAAGSSRGAGVGAGAGTGDSMSYRGDSVYLKLQRLASKTEIQFINPPRRNTKLLVLDLDHTLMDFSCRFDYMAEQLKRPHLDAFLARTYVYYDIAVWSQTNFKWLELKLTELGMLNRKDYKICFALVRPHLI